MKNPLISIIIPVFNAEKKLRLCLDSILSQSFSDWECLLVDDGSTDNSGRICEEYEENNDRFLVFHKDNGGVSSARNFGIKESKGEWIAFIDADDYVCEDYLANFVEKLDADLLLCGFTSSQGINFLPEDSFWRKDNLKTGIEYLVNDKFLIYTPWCKLFNASIIKNNHLQFNTSIFLSEDTIFCYQYLYHIQSVRTVPSNGYFYDGIWGGGKKYALTLNDALLIQRNQVDAIKKLNEKFNCHIDYKYKGYWYSQVRDLYSILTLRDVYIYYCQNHEKILWDEFQKDILLNFIYDSFGACINGYNREKVKDIYNCVKKFYNGTELGLKGLNLAVKIYAFLLNSHLHVLNLLYMRTYILIKGKNRNI